MRRPLDLLRTQDRTWAQLSENEQQSRAHASRMRSGRSSLSGADRAHTRKARRRLVANRRVTDSELPRRRPTPAIWIRPIRGNPGSRRDAKAYGIAFDAQGKIAGACLCTEPQ